MKKISLTTIIFIIIGISLSGEPLFSTISGTVTDAGGNPLPGVLVTLYCEDREPVETVTTKEGKFRFLFLYPGTYNLKLEGRGFSTRAKEGIFLHQGKNFKETFILR